MPCLNRKLVPIRHCMAVMAARLMYPRAISSHTMQKQGGISSAATGFAGISDGEASHIGQFFEHVAGKHGCFVHFSGFLGRFPHPRNGPWSAAGFFPDRSAYGPPGNVFTKGCSYSTTLPVFSDGGFFRPYTKNSLPSRKTGVYPRPKQCYSRPGGSPLAIQSLFR